MSQVLPPPVTRPLGWAAAATSVLAITCLVLGLIELVSIQPHRLIVGVGSTILLIAYAIALALIARALWRGSRWSRGPAVALQILHIAVAFSFWGGTTSWVAVVVVALALIVIISVLLPSSTAVLVGRDD